MPPIIPRIGNKQNIKDLEKRIDEFQHELSGFVRFTKFVAIDVNEARVRTRTLERSITDLMSAGELRKETFKFINRLSDYLFTASLPRCV